MRKKVSSKKKFQKENPNSIKSTRNSFWISKKVVDGLETLINVIQDQTAHGVVEELQSVNALISTMLMIYKKRQYMNALKYWMILKIKLVVISVNLTGTHKNVTIMTIAYGVKETWVLQAIVQTTSMVLNSTNHTFTTAI